MYILLPLLDKYIWLLSFTCLVYDQRQSVYKTDIVFVQVYIIHKFKMHSDMMFSAKMGVEEE